MEKKLGKIESITFGIGGYQDCMIGLHLTISADGWGVGDSKCAWDAESIPHTVNCKWTEESRDNEYAKIMRYVSKLLKDAKVSDVSKLKGVPVEVVFDGNQLKEWRILTEVL